MLYFVLAVGSLVIDLCFLAESGALIRCFLSLNRSSARNLLSGKCLLARLILGPEAGYRCVADEQEYISVK